MATFYVSMLNFMWDTFKTTHLHRSHAWKFCVECVMDSCPLQVTFFANGQPLWIINVYNTYTIYTCGMYISQCVYKYCIRNNIDSIKVYKKSTSYVHCFMTMPFSIFAAQLAFFQQSKSIFQELLAMNRTLNELDISMNLGLWVKCWFYGDS